MTCLGVRRRRRCWQLVVTSLSLTTAWIFIFYGSDLQYNMSYASGNDSSIKARMEDTHTPPAIPRVLLLSYQRCGSSFMGQLFNQNPNAFYVFEPADSVYVNMYGTSAGWSVPSDITHSWDGNIRCEMENMPPEFFLHTYWTKFPGSIARLTSFQKCKVKYENILEHCRQQFIAPLCPMRFGEAPERHETCRTSLLEAREKAQHTAIQGQATTKFTSYLTCVSEARNNIENCTSLMKSVCENSTIRSTKTVRVTMDTVEVLLKKEPHLKVIHLIRDPRAVALSRMGRPSFRGHHSGNDMIKEAKSYCEDVYRDLMKRRDLQSVYPQNFHQLIYEEFIEDPLAGLNSVYDFIGRPPSKDAQLWFKNMSSSRTVNATKIATKWMDKLNARTKGLIHDYCKDVFANIDYAWP